MIKEQAISGIKWTSVASLSGNILQLVQLVIVAKFITAADYGLMSLTLIIIYFAQLLGDMGISNALIYTKRISTLAFSSLFWISLLFSWSLFGVLFFLSPYLSIFFKQPVLSAVIRITALSFIFLPVQMQYRALLRKELRFSRIAMVDILSRLITLIVAVMMALTGSGVFALVYSTLAGLAVSTVFFFYWGSQQMPITFNCKIGEVKEFMHFGVYQTGNDILSYFNFHVDTFLLGRLVGIDALGFYSFAKNLALKPAQIINPVITQVAFPLMVKVNSNDASVRKIYLKMVNYLCTVNFLIYPFLAASSLSIISFFFGSKWLPAAPVLQGLAFYCMVRSVFNPIGILLTSKGMVRKLFYWNILLLFIVPVVVFFAAAAGISWVAAAMSVILLICFYPMWKFLVFPACQAHFNEFWQCIKIPLINAMVLYLLLTIFNIFSPDNTVVKLWGSFAVWIIAGFLITRIMNNRIFTEVAALAGDLPNQAAKLFGL